MTKQNISIFELKELATLKAKQHKFYDLSINGIFQLERFEKELEKKYLAEFQTILYLMDRCSNGESLPHTKMKDITPNGEAVKEYEFKSKHLRVYAIQQPGSKVVILGGTKNNQSKDISAFRSLKSKFLLSKDPKKY